MGALARVGWVRMDNAQSWPSLAVPLREGEVNEGGWPPASPPLLLVLSGPSGVGKDALLARLKSRGHPLHIVVTATTRPRRPRESEGVDYHFLTEAEFERLKEQGGLLEHAVVYGYHYGVPKAPVQEALAQGQDVIIRADVQGSATIKGLLPPAVLVFLAPASWQELQERLRRRRTEGEDELNRRLAIAREELEKLPLFDYLVVNREDHLDRAVAAVEAIMAAERCRVGRRPIQL